MDSSIIIIQKSRGSPVLLSIGIRYRYIVYGIPDNHNPLVVM